MTIRIFLHSDISAAVKLWNESNANGDFCYKPLSEQKFEAIFFENLHYSQEYMLAAIDAQEKLIGFISGVIKREYLREEDFTNTPGYITMVIVQPGSRNQGVGASLVHALEARFQAIGKQDVRITYRNPVMLSWIVPNSPGHDHNNAAGVDMESVAYLMFQKLEYKTQAVELGMYRKLKKFSPIEKYNIKIENLSKIGIQVELYDAKKHVGFDVLFDNLHGEVWRKSISDNLALAQSLPIIVASDHGKIVGFAGPIDQQESGRGWFNGIATHSQYEGKGIAFVMFTRLMEEFQKIGAEFSTLFTDDANPAYYLYKSTGFEIVKKWAVMNKELNKMVDQKHIIMAIGAHIGDMELTCGGVLASHSLRGDQIITVALTAGEKGNPTDMSVEDYRKQKVQEAQAFALALGGESVVLNNPDGLLKYDEHTTWAVCDLIRKYKPDVIITHWKESVHKDHFNTSKIVSDARYYAGNVGFKRILPAHACPNLYFTENWEDSLDFKPYLYVDISEGYDLWYCEVKKHWFVTHSTDYRYLEYYDALSICRGCESGKPRAQAFMVRELRDKSIKNFITD